MFITGEIQKSGQKELLKCVWVTRWLFSRSFGWFKKQVNVSSNFNRYFITFCGMVFFRMLYWFLIGLVRILSNCIGEPVKSNLEISIPPVKLFVTTKSNKQLTILPPTEYVGKRPVMLRLVSHKMRVGSVGSGGGTTRNLDEMSRTLIVHCHGGGFVAQSSNSHLVYLKSWAKSAGAPIVSIDYSLAPEAPYPRALHEAFYSYLWAIQNAHLLGSTAEKVIVAGDSAGGLLLTGVILLCIELNVRVPDGALLVYTPQLLEPSISPARLLSLCDPLIPYPALAACLGGIVTINLCFVCHILCGSINRQDFILYFSLRWKKFRSKSG